MRKEILSFTDQKPDGRLIHDLEEAAVHISGFAPGQDSFFVFIMRPDMIRELELLADEEGAGRNAPLLVVAFADPRKPAARAESLFSLHAMAAEAERQNMSSQYAPFAVRVFQDPSFRELSSACGVPSGYGCTGAILLGEENESVQHEAHYNVFSYIQ
ncbi:MAG: hypothetical protein IKG53_03850 [Solobacterium sp.]|nr:hypothetical protein [Solobacterium sp.]